VQTVRLAAEESGAHPLDGERKTVTALFADIKGSMGLNAPNIDEQLEIVGNGWTGSGNSHRLGI